MSRQVNKEEFIAIVTKIGYANKKQTKEWCEKNSKDDYSDKDFEEVFQYAQRTLRGDIEKVRPKKLRYRNTPEEAFADYKKHKEAYIIMMADKYMDYLPVEIYDALIDYEVEPF